MALDVAVVGGGAAGLAAAWRLSEAGAAVTLYERRPAVGGRLRTDELDGVRVDVAVQLLASHFTETFRLARAAGAGDLLVRSPGRDALWRGGRAHGISYGSAVSMARSGALPLGLKGRLAARYLPFLRRHAPALDGNAPARAVQAGLRESIGAWGTRELGQDFVELLVYPLLASYYGLTPYDTASGLYHALAHEGLDVQVYGVRGGMERLAEALAVALQRRGVQLVTGREVEALSAGQESVVVTAQGERRHQAAVLALPPPQAAALQGLAPALHAWLARVRTRPTTSVALALSAPAPGEWFGLAFPRTEVPGRALAAVCAQERKVPGMAPPGRGALMAFPAPALAERVEEAPASAVVDGVLEALRRTLPAAAQRVTRARVYRLPSGTTIFDAAHFDALAALDPGVGGPRLALAGDYLRAPTVEGAVRSGLAAADRLLGALGALR